jgi:hypothetical protein
MFGRDFGFYVVSFLTALAATACGVLCVSIAWVQMGNEPKQRTPNLMYTFCGAIACNAVGMAFPWCVGPNAMGFGEASLIIGSLLIASLILVVTTLKLLSPYEGSGRGALKAGSIIMVVVYLLGCVGVLSV